MALHPFIQTLTASADRWGIPDTPSHDSSDWCVAWERASDHAKGNLARAWLWTVTNHLNATSSLTLEYAFLSYLNQGLEWVQTIQPYLDSEFFTPLRHTEPWPYLESLLVPAVPALNDDVTLLRRFFFGSQTEKAALLLEVAPDLPGILSDRIGPATTVAAWQIAQCDDAQLVRAACVVSSVVGRSCTEPHPELPALARLWQHIGTYARYRKMKKLPQTVPALSTLQQQLHALPPTLVAGVFVNWFDLESYKTKDGTHYMRTDSFLVEHTSDTDPYAVLARWIPARETAFTNAKALGVSPLEALTLIASEVVPTTPLALPEHLALGSLDH